MRLNMRKIFLWLPRILGVLFAVFIGMFAMDVFNQGYLGFDLVLAFLIHLIPAIIIIAFTLVGWRWPLSGTALFTVIGTVYIYYISGQPWLVYALISGPLYLVAVLFTISNILNKPNGEL